MNTSEPLNKPSPPFAMAESLPPVPASGLHPLAVLVLSALIGLAAAVPVGFLTGFATYSAMAADCGSDGWCELGAALGGGVIGVIVGFVAYVVAGAVTINRWRAPGERAVLALAHAGSPLLLVALLYVVSTLGL